MLDLANKLKAKQVRVVEVPGWESHARPYSFEPIGIMLHDTHDKRPLEHLRNGDKWMPGPLGNFLVSRSGNVYLISAGYTNHAGKGVAKVLNQTRKDEAPSFDARTRGRVVGNKFYYGVHVEHPEGRNYPPVQIHAMVALCAALCEMNGWSHNRVIHHREWTSRHKDMEFNGIVRDRVENVMTGLETRNYFMDCSSGVFQVGDEGECVRILQSHLLRHGANLSPNGFYDEKTKGAVRKFQLDNKITSDGIVGPQTWRYLKRSVQQEQVDLAGHYPVLREGVISEYVNTVRVLLNRIGYSVEGSNRVFGVALHDVVREFQRDNDLEETGVVGPETWATISSKAENFASPMVCEQQTFSNGDKDHCVEKLKGELREKGFNIEVDDEYDSSTESVVRRFQKMFGISSDGVCGPETWMALERDYDLPRAVVYTDNFGKCLALMLSEHYGIPATSYLDKRTVREAILIHEAARHADRYLESRKIRGVNHKATVKLVYNELIRGDIASV